MTRRRLHEASVGSAEKAGDGTGLLWAGTGSARRPPLNSTTMAGLSLGASGMDAPSMTFLGVDAGVSGASVILDLSGNEVGSIRHTETDHDICRFLGKHSAHIVFGLLERVHAMPKQGVSSTFKFGRSFGFCGGLLAAFQIPLDLITPRSWQTSMKCRSGGNKQITKAAAQRLFPNTKIVHATADAFLLAELARRTFNTRRGKR